MLRPLVNPVNSQFIGRILAHVYSKLVASPKMRNVTSKGMANKEFGCVKKPTEGKGDCGFIAYSSGLRGKEAEELRKFAGCPLVGIDVGRDMDGMICAPEASKMLRNILVKTWVDVKDIIIRETATQAVFELYTQRAH